MAIIIEDGIACVMQDGVVQFMDGDVEEIDIQDPTYSAPWSE